MSVLSIYSHLKFACQAFERNLWRKVKNQWTNCVILKQKQRHTPPPKKPLVEHLKSNTVIGEPGKMSPCLLDTNSFKSRSNSSILTTSKYLRWVTRAGAAASVFIDIACSVLKKTQWGCNRSTVASVALIYRVVHYEFCCNVLRLLRESIRQTRPVPLGRCVPANITIETVFLAFLHKLYCLPTLRHT